MGMDGLRSDARREAYAAIDSERAYQDQMWPADADGTKTVGDFIVLLQEYVARARVAWTDNRGDAAALEVVRKVAGIAVRCMELHGAPRREGF